MTNITICSKLWIKTSDKKFDNLFQVWADNPSDPHAVFYKTSAVANSDPNLFVSRQEDGGILIDPEHPGEIRKGI